MPGDLSREAIVKFLRNRLLILEKPRPACERAEIAVEIFDYICVYFFHVNQKMGENFMKVVKRKAHEFINIILGGQFRGDVDNKQKLLNLCVTVLDKINQPQCVG
jgi:hypothetical protein